MSSATQTYVPLPNVKFIDPRTGDISREWYRFFVALMNRLGGPDGPSMHDLELDLSTMPFGNGAVDTTSLLSELPAAGQTSVISNELLELASVRQEQAPLNSEVLLLSPLQPLEQQDSLTPPATPPELPGLDLAPPSPTNGYGNSVTGARGGNVALASLLGILATQGIITNNTTP